MTLIIPPSRQITQHETTQDLMIRSHITSAITITTDIGVMTFFMTDVTNYGDPLSLPRSRYVMIAFYGGKPIYYTFDMSFRHAFGDDDVETMADRLEAMTHYCALEIVKLIRHATDNLEWWELPDKLTHNPNHLKFNEWSPNLLLF